jgi:hypothetical protein
MTITALSETMTVGNTILGEAELRRGLEAVA